MKAHDQILQIVGEELIRSQSKNPSYSVRAYAKRLDLVPSALSEILGGKRRITYKTAKKILYRLGVAPDRAEKLLQSLAPPSRKRSININSSDTLTSSKEFIQLNMDKFHILADWFYFAIYSLAETNEFKANSEWISKRLGIQKRQAQIALERLERLGLFEKTPDGKLKTTGISIATTTDIEDLSLRKSHFQNLELAKCSLEQDKIDERDFSSITMVSNPKKIIEAKKRIQKFRRDLCSFLEDLPPEEKTEVFQTNIQFFKLTKNVKKRSSA